MYDLISIGGISIDFYFKGESLTFKDSRFQLAIGGKYVVDYFYEGLGGGGANVSIGTHKNGLNSAVMGIIGNNVFKKIILEKLDNFEVSYNLCHFEDNFYNISTILLTPSGERSIIHYISPHQHLFQTVQSINRLNDAKVVYLGNLPDLSLTQRINALRHAKEHNILTVVNLGVKDCRRQKTQLEDLLKKTDILILNGHEFSELVKAPYKDIYFYEDVITHYIPHLKSQLVVITEGKKGSYGYFEGKVYHQKAKKIDKIVDTTGAGDGYTSGFIAEYFKSKNIEKAMEKGAIYAAKILAKIGAN